MARGEFESGWRISDETIRSFPRERNAELPPWRRVVWDGRPLEGRRVLVRCYHGLGDTIQFSRYLPLLRRMAAEVTVALPASLFDLFSDAACAKSVGLVPADEAGVREFDAEVEIMELAHVFRTIGSAIPDIPHLDIEPAAIRRDERIAVGIVWSAGIWDRRRSVDISELTPWARLPGISLYSLQLEPYAAGWHNDLGTALDARGIYETARLIKALDLIITVDTMTAHLAGTLRKPVWTLLQSDADWRWMLEREDSPWYPTMRLFRQKHQGGWGPVIASVTGELERLSRQYETGGEPVPWDHAGAGFTSRAAYL